MTLILFSAPWVAPCRLQEPIIGRLASRFQGRATIGAVNVGGSPETAWNWGIRSVPTVVLFKNGKEIQRLIGLQSEETLSDALKRLLE
ncbi:MAG: thiol reductase thioredoxin [Deltaproteobacteria bacterium]|nr:thiol reductase thioredoxin [Deltaproteobacteria bacterium]